MSEDHDENLLAEALEEYHRCRARGERPDEEALRGRLGDLYPEFLELVAAETLIDRALLGDPMEPKRFPEVWGGYTLLREIARGGAGVVYEASHRTLGRTVALKMLRTGIDTDARARERFLREARALAQVKHDHIVEIHEYGDVDGTPFYTMQLVEGETLATLVKADKRPDPQTLCRGLAGIADALASLHAAGIIHRDVKPQNIMVDSNGRYMLADFGLARTAMSETMTQTGDALGTPFYMSPEQMRADRNAVDARSDIYGLGATLYELLGGVRPFPAETIEALYPRVLRERPVSPRTHDPEIPPEVAGIALKCLEKRREDRYPDAESLRADLLAFSRGDGVQGGPVPAWKRTLREVGAHPVLAAAALILLAFGVWTLMQPPEPASVSLATSIEADARLNGGDAEPTPWVARSVSPERPLEILVTPRDPEYLPVRLDPFTAKPGEHIRYPEVWFPPKRGVANLEALDKLRDRVGGEAPPDKRPEIDRGRDPALVQALLPRGPVRPEDVGTLRIDVGAPTGRRREPVFEDGEFVFFVDGAAVATLPAPATNLTGLQELALPADVRASLEPGATVRWGYRFRGSGDLLTEATFTVREPDPALSARVAAAKATAQEAWSQIPDQADMAGRILAAEILLQADLPYAAYREIIAPYEARAAAIQAREQARRAAPEIAALEAEYDAAEARLRALQDTPIPRDPARLEAYQRAIDEADARVQELDARFQELTAEGQAHRAAPDELRSQRLLTVLQLAIERMFPNEKERKATPLWGRLGTWRDMFDLDAWDAYYQR